MQVLLSSHTHMLTCMCALQGFSIPVRQRLADYTFSHFRMCLWLNVPEAQRLTALRNVLTQCTSLNVTGTVAITGCQWTDAVVQAALQGIPQLSHLQFAFYCMDALTDELLGAALQLGSCMPTLYATGIELQSSKHAYKVWPCKVFNVQKFDMNMLPLLPMAREAGSEPVVQCRVVSLDTREQAKSPVRLHSTHNTQPRIRTQYTLSLAIACHTMFAVLCG